jgi:hypothetical protein
MKQTRQAVRAVKQSIFLTCLWNIVTNSNGTALKNVNNYWNTNIFFHLETPGGKKSNLYLNVVHFF